MIDALLYWFFVIMLFMFPSTMLCYLIFETMYRIERYCIIRKMRRLDAGRLMDELLRFYEICEETIKRRQGRSEDF